LATRDQGWRKPLYQGGTGFSGRVIEFDGNSWTTILENDYWIFSLETYGSKLYAGTANKILSYNGIYWEVSFNTTEDAYYAISLKIHDGIIYAGMGNGYLFADPLPSKTNNEIVAIPEFPSAITLSLLMVLSIMIVIFPRKKHQHKMMSKI
jgi:hypothetical protein